MAFQNPQVVEWNPGSYAIRFVRRSWTVLHWVQDMTGRKMKDLAFVDLPVVTFPTRAEAEAEVTGVVLAYLVEQKRVDPEQIAGW